MFRCQPLSYGPAARHDQTSALRRGAKPALPIQVHEAYTNMEIMPEALPLARNLASEVLSLPMGPQLSLDQVQDIVNALKNA